MPKKQKKKDADKDYNLAIIALEFQQGAVTFKEFYSKLTYRVTFPYEDGNDYDCQFEVAADKSLNLDENSLKMDENSLNSDKNEICYIQKIEFENPFREIDFMKRIDKTKTAVNPKVGLTTELLYHELKVINDFMGIFAV